MNNDNKTDAAVQSTGLAGALVRLLAHIIYWTGVAVMALLLLAAIAMLVLILREPGEIEKALTALGGCLVILVLSCVWVWAKIKLDEPNSRHEP